MFSAWQLIQLNTLFLAMLMLSKPMLFAKMLIYADIAFPYAVRNYVSSQQMLAFHQPIWLCISVPSPFMVIMQECDMYRQQVWLCIEQ